MAHEDQRNFEGSDRRTPRPPPRGQHPSLNPVNASPAANASPEDFLGLDVEVQRAAQRPSPSAPLEVQNFAPEVNSIDPRVSTNTTLIPRSALFARNPGQAPQSPAAGDPNFRTHAQAPPNTRSQAQRPHAQQPPFEQQQAQHPYAQQQHAQQQHAQQQHAQQQHAQQQHAQQQHAQQQHAQQQHAQQQLAQQQYAQLQQNQQHAQQQHAQQQHAQQQHAQQLAQQQLAQQQYAQQQHAQQQQIQQQAQQQFAQQQHAQQQRAQAPQAQQPWVRPNHAQPQDSQPSHAPFTRGEPLQSQAGVAEQVFAPSPRAEQVSSPHTRTPHLFAPPTQPAPAASPLTQWMQPTPSEMALHQRAAPVNSNSWLLALDDARAGRAGVEPVVHDPSHRATEVEAPALLDTSFAEAPPVASRTFPWIVRGLIAVAAGSFLFVVGHTVFSPKRADSKIEVVAPVAPRRTPVEPRAELADPGPANVTTAPVTAKTSTRGPRAKQPQPVPRSPARPTIPEAITPSATAIPVPEELPPTFIEIPPPDFAPIVNPNGAAPLDEGAPKTRDANGAPLSSAADMDLPPWYPGLVRSTPLAQSELAPNATELSGSPERKERVQRYLMKHSRGASPLEDTSAEYTPPVRTASLADIGGMKRPPQSKSIPASVDSASAKSKAAMNLAPRAGSVWEGAVVPVDQIASKEQVLTPRVGLVRVTLASGDVKEGRLHAVGQSQIWIDQPRGHEAIPRSRIERLEQVGDVRDPLAYPGEKPAPKTTATTADKNADKRVRVRTAGGLFYGKIVAREGDSITLKTDDGSEVRIEGGSVEAAPERKTIVKREAPSKPATPKLPPPVPTEPDEDPDFNPDDPHGVHSRPPPAPGS